MPTVELRQGHKSLTCRKLCRVVAQNLLIVLLGVVIRTGHGVLQEAEHLCSGCVAKCIF